MFSGDGLNFEPYDGIMRWWCGWRVTVAAEKYDPEAADENDGTGQVNRLTYPSNVMQYVWQMDVTGETTDAFHALMRLITLHTQQDTHKHVMMRPRSRRRFTQCRLNTWSRVTSAFRWIWIVRRIADVMRLLVYKPKHQHPADKANSHTHADCTAHTVYVHTLFSFKPARGVTLGKAGP